MTEFFDRAAHVIGAGRYVAQPHTILPGACMVIDSVTNALIATFYDIWDYPGSGEGVCIALGATAAQDYVEIINVREEASHVS